MITTCLRTFAFLIITVLLNEVTQVKAELYGAPRDFGWKKSVPLHLILDPKVVSDIGLNEEVAGKIKVLQNQTQKELEEELAKTHSKANAKPGIHIVSRNPDILHTIRNMHTDEINALLTPEQQSRLHQIHLQNSELPSDARLFGLGRTVKKEDTDVLSDSAVAKELELTNAQQNEIRSIHSAITRAEGLLVKTGRQTGPSYRDLMRESPAKILNVLTAEQREAFYKLMGKPLKIYSTK